MSAFNGYFVGAMAKNAQVIVFNHSEKSVECEESY